MRLSLCAVHEGMDLRDDGKRYGLGRSAAEVEPDGRPKARAQMLGIGAELGQQLLTPRRRSEQAYVADRAGAQDAQALQVRRQVMGHHHGRSELSQAYSRLDRLWPRQQHPLGHWK